VGVGGAFGFNRGLMLTGFHQFAPGRGFQLARDQLDFKAPEKHPTGGHFKNERIKPVDQQQFVIGRAASDAEVWLGVNRAGVYHHGRQHEGRLLESSLFGGSNPADAEIGLVPEVTPNDRKTSKPPPRSTMVAVLYWHCMENPGELTA